MKAWIACLLIGTAAPAIAQTGFQDTATLDRAVANFTGRPIGAEGGARTPVDPRLKLAPCSTLMMKWRQDNHDAVVITCADAEWRIFVPVVMPAVAPPPSVAAPAPVAAPVVQPKPEIVIKRGDPVSVEVNSGGFSVTRDGIAMTDAAAGARLLVDVAGPKKPIQAIALEPGRATLPGFSR
ncbi:MULTISPECIES: flagella basal body P-ring formation protein FlgA [Sphingomonas]|uniref:flagella basal body P-ring formation protein FlgA n=1 Tax=Sphingomonas TaxID=13687 RepID=UPI00083687D1|nr:flagella basal body P-ring formation protein FlgA [Sphingomonas sp. CCH10-B3]